MDRKNLEEIERNFYREFIEAGCDYLQKYIWTFTLYSCLFLLGVWFAFHLIKKQETEHATILVFKRPCEPCEQAKQEQEKETEEQPI